LIRQTVGEKFLPVKGDEQYEIRFFSLDKPCFLLYICILKTLKAMNQEIQQYQSDDARITLDVRVENDTVWLT